MIYHSPAAVETMHRANQKPTIADTKTKVCKGWSCTRKRKGGLVHSIKQHELPNGSIADTGLLCRGCK